VNSPSFEEVVRISRELREVSHQFWLENTFLTWRWWLLVALTIVPWLVWWKFVDKNRLQPILFYGVLTALFALVVDSVGSNLQWWVYPNEVYAVIPPLIPVDLTLVPVTMMFVYQISTTWKSFIINNMLLALPAAYIVEPLFIWVDFYQPIDWKHTYSVVFYMVGGIFCRWIVLATLNKKR
jgi:hypothetical protein